MKYFLIAVSIAIVFYIFIPYFVKNKLWPEKIENPPMFIFWLILFVHHTSYILYNLLLYFIYKADNPFFEQFKNHNETWPWKENKQEFISLLKRGLKQILLNQYIVIPIFLFLNTVILKRMKLRTDLESFPSLFELIWQNNFFRICDDFLFYWSHRFLHWKPIYTYIHKIHHEFKITVGIASEYTHPIEFLFGNVLPTSFGSMLLGNKTHLFTYALWIAEKMYNTTESHSGYQFPFSPTTLVPFKLSSEHHNYHHLKFVGNYGGPLYFWDYLCGTENPDYIKSLDSKKKQS